MFSLATLVYINEYKAKSNCNQDPTFRHSSLVSSSGSAFFKDFSVVGQNCQKAHFPCPLPPG